MGCDIHAHIEYRWRDDDTAWWYFAEVKIDRNYEIFAHMAGVRNQEDIEVLVPARGMPNTAAIATAACWREWEGDAHTPSWLFYNELLVCVPPDVRDLTISAALAAMRAFADRYGGDNVRLVFWFDN